MSASLSLVKLLRITVLKPHHNCLSTVLLIDHPPLLAGKLCIVLCCGGENLYKIIVCAGEGGGNSGQHEHPVPVGLCHSPKVWPFVADVAASVIESDNGSSGKICDRGASTECLVELVNKTV